MRELRKRHKIKRWLYSNTAVIILLMLAVLVWEGVWGMYRKEVESSASLRETKQRYAQLEHRHNELEEKISRLQTPAGKEEEVREKFNVVKDGEHVVVLVEPSAASTTSQDESTGVIDGLWQRVLDWFR